MSHTLLARPARGTNRPTPVLPPAGPAWFGAVMGTGILASLLHSHPAIPGAGVAAPALLLLDWILLVTLTVGYLARIVNDRNVIRRDASDPVTQMQWGMVSMGILSVGSATLAIAPSLAASLEATASQIDVAFWLAGTALGLATTFGFTVTIIRGRAGGPTFTWGLPVVPPMVSATTGAALVPHATGPMTLIVLLACCACFVLSLCLGGIIFTLAYLRHLRSTALPIPASASAWIPLGVVGQSTAAAQVIAGHATPLLTADSAAQLQSVANAYGLLMLTLGIPLVAYATRATIRGFLAAMPFSPGWWALTFPIGTLATGASLLGCQPGWSAYAVVGLLAVLTLCGTWALCATVTVRALATRD